MQHYQRQGVDDLIRHHPGHQRRPPQIAFFREPVLVFRRRRLIRACRHRNNMRRCAASLYCRDLRDKVKSNFGNRRNSHNNHNKKCSSIWLVHSRRGCHPFHRP
jgi:hypothetical protein